MNKIKFIKAYLDLIRVNYWFKNIFVLPGIFFLFYWDTWFFYPWKFSNYNCILHSNSLVCSSNYVINEITDAEYDNYNIKKNRPIVSGK